MIRITVTGDSYQVRKLLKQSKFRRNVGLKGWQKTIGEASLNHTLEKIRPPVSWSETPSPKITITLESVDVWGKKMHEGILKFRLKEVGERNGVDFLKRFCDEVCAVQVITNHSISTNTEKKEERNVDEHFF